VPNQRVHRFINSRHSLEILRRLQQFDAILIQVATDVVALQIGAVAQHCTPPQPMSRPSIWRDTGSASRVNQARRACSRARIRPSRASASCIFTLLFVYYADAAWRQAAQAPQSSKAPRVSDIQANTPAAAPGSTCMIQLIRRLYHV
jgi:hypothetical protein